MDLSNYIKHIFEGGNALQGCGPIPGDIAKIVFDKFKSELVSYKQGLKIEPIGSTYKKTSSQMCGDLDCAIEYKWSKNEDIFKFLRLMPDVLDINISEGFKIVNISYAWSEKHQDGIVQIDLMFTNDIEEAQFVYWSPDYTRNESQYKGLVRNILLSTIIRSIPVNEADEYFDQEYNGAYKNTIKRRWRYVFSSSEGIKKVLEDFTGKTKPLLRPVKLKEYQEIIANTPIEIMKFIFGKSSDASDFVSFESLWVAMHSKKFLYPDKVKWIESEMRKYASDNSLDIKELE